MPSSEPQVQQHQSGYSENADFWIKIIREGLDPYRTELTDQLVIRATNPRAGMTVLDAGCGEGYLSREFARRGAAVTGIDASEAFINAAVHAAAEDGLQVKYQVATVDDIPVADSSVDIVVCNHLLTDLQDLNRPLSEFRRVLRPGGRLVVLMLHPCFYVARAERPDTRWSIAADEYFTPRTIEQHFDVAGITSPAPVRQWFRPLEDYMGSITEAGFALTGLSEPHPTAAQVESNPWWRNNFPRPLFLLMEAFAVHSDEPLTLRT